MAASRRDDMARSGSGDPQDPSSVECIADQTESNGEDLTNILSGIPGAWEHAQGSIIQANRGETVPLPEL